MIPYLNTHTSPVLVTDNSKTRSLFIRIMELLDMVWGSESDGVAEIDVDVRQELEGLFQISVSGW